MEISIKKEELQKKSLFVATPMYGGQNHGLYMKACLDLQGLCMQYGIQIKFSFLFNESLITRARNYLVDEFLHRSDCTHLLFIDSDINFNPQDVVAMLALDKDVIGGPYPKKAIKWRSVKRAVEKNPEIEPQLLEKVAGDSPVFALSSQAHVGLTDVLRELRKEVVAIREAEKAEDKTEDEDEGMAVISLNQEDKALAWHIKKVSEGEKKIFVVKGHKIEKFARRTQFDNYEGVNRLRDIMKKMGITHALLRDGAEGDSVIRIGADEFTLLEQ